MSEMSIGNARLREGVWQAVLVAPEGATSVPEVEVIHLGKPLDNVRLHADPEMASVWTLTVPVPVELLSDGVQTFLVKEKGSNDTLARFAISAGVPLEQDVMAEMALLRAELDLLKQAFRRHHADAVNARRPA